MIVRRERAGDVAVVRAVHAAAFRQRRDEEPAEARLLDALRVSDAWIPRLSLVAERGEEIVGHVVCTRAHVGEWGVLGLGPIAVRPDVQYGGVGSALMHAVIGAADAIDEPLIGLLGSDVYYRRFGFVAASTVGVTAPDPSWAEHFQVRTLAAHETRVRGLFRYPPPFDDI